MPAKGWDEYRAIHLEQHISRKWIEAQLRLAPPNATEEEVARNVEAHRERQRGYNQKHQERMKIEREARPGGSFKRSVSDELMDYVTPDLNDASAYDDLWIRSVPSSPLPASGSCQFDEIRAAGNGE